MICKDLLTYVILVANKFSDYSSIVIIAFWKDCKSEKETEIKGHSGMLLEILHKFFIT